MTLTDIKSTLAQQTRKSYFRPEDQVKSNFLCCVTCGQEIWITLRELRKNPLHLHNRCEPCKRKSNNNL